MQKGDIYELSHWFEGEKSDWVIYISTDTDHEELMLKDTEFCLLGNIFSSDLGIIVDNLKHTTIEDLREAVIEVNHEEYWDDEDSMSQIEMLLVYLGVTIGEVSETLAA